MHKDSLEISLILRSTKLEHACHSVVLLSEMIGLLVPILFSRCSFELPSLLEVP